MPLPFCTNLDDMPLVLSDETQQVINAIESQIIYAGWTDAVQYGRILPWMLYQLYTGEVLAVEYLASIPKYQPYILKVAFAEPKPKTA